jgi:uncharacterized protein
MALSLGNFLLAARVFAGETGECVLRSVCVGLVLAAFFASGPVQSAEREAKRDAGDVFLGLIAGPVAGSEAVLAADLASLFPEGDLNILPILGDAGAGNLARLDALKVDLAFVATDALAEAAAKDASLHERLELVTRLAPQEVHILARADIGKLSDLAGREVNFGPEGSASAITAAALFKALQVEVAASSLDFAAAIERLKSGTISAVVFVGGKPSPVIGAIPPNSGIHLLPVAFSEALAANYLPTRLAGTDYPNLIEPGGEVPTVATGLVLLAASLPGFKRNAAAASWLLGDQDRSKKGPAIAKADASQGPQLVGSPSMSKEQKETLFERFIEWQQGNDR